MGMQNLNIELLVTESESKISGFCCVLWRFESMSSTIGHIKGEVNGKA